MNISQSWNLKILLQLCFSLPAVMMIMYNEKSERFGRPFLWKLQSKRFDLQLCFSRMTKARWFFPIDLWGFLNPNFGKPHDRKRVAATLLAVFTHWNQEYQCPERLTIICPRYILECCDVTLRPAFCSMPLGILVQTRLSSNQTFLQGNLLWFHMDKF